MTAGNVADTVSAGDDGETEGQRRQQIADAVDGVTTDEHRRTATHKGEHSRTDKFSNVLFHSSHFPFFFMSLQKLSDNFIKIVRQ